MAAAHDILGRVPCPCCGYPTLTEPAAYEICELCNWEDDGQGEADADQVRGGPNGAYSLAEARQNFRAYGVMYASGRDTRLWADSEQERVAKRTLNGTFERFTQTPAHERPAVLTEIRQLEALLEAELLRQGAEHDARHFGIDPL